MQNIVNTKELSDFNLDNLTNTQLIAGIKELKKELHEDVIILGHHYQQDDIFQFADFKGDSLQLAKDVAKLNTPYIIFCGVHFMAETADILTGPEQKVILPSLGAGCSMADMAKIGDVKNAWSRITSATTQKIIPITYVNSTAAIKAFIGKHDGTICTSSNAKEVISWAFERGEKLLFFPDQHLGRNTSYEIGIKPKEMVTYNPNIQNGGLTDEQIKKAKVILWYGYCSVHEGFQLEHIKQLRRSEPKTKIIVHPECSFDVVQSADSNGSTSYIIQHVQQAASGSSFAIGTEINLVNRLQREMPEKKIISLSPFQCLCTTMSQINTKLLYTSLLAIKNKKPINIINVDKETSHFASMALKKMLSIKKK